MPLPSPPRPLPPSCNMCGPNDICVAFDINGKAVDIYSLNGGIYAQGMYRIACKNKFTGELTDAGGCIDVGNNCMDFIPGTVYEDRRIFEDPWWKKFLVPLFAFGAAVSLIATVMIFSNSKK